jgi:hypothetical protein
MNFDLPEYPDLVSIPGVQELVHTRLDDVVDNWHEDALPRAKGVPLEEIIKPYELFFQNPTAFVDHIIEGYFFLPGPDLHILWIADPPEFPRTEDLLHWRQLVADICQGLAGERALPQDRDEEGKPQVMTFDVFCKAQWASVRPGMEKPSVETIRKMVSTLVQIGCIELRTIAGDTTYV